MPSRPLQTYNEKRNFRITSEPEGKLRPKKQKDLMFVVQKHDATRLHYDFRLELDGVLLSWAVPKGPSLYPKDKRLAARTEDHPISYGDFEGIIPEKQYGAGPVMVWDTGIWVPLDDDPQKALKKGKINFELRGEKLHGQWTLARMNETKDKKENWLLIKRSDEESLDHEDPDFLKRTDYSVKTQRPFSDIAEGKKIDKPRKGLSLSELEKKYKAVQLATLSESPPKSEDWVHEVKYDGYRILCFVHDGKVKIKTRNGNDWTKKFPHIAEALQSIKGESFIIDGEAVVLDPNGLSNFKKLQNAFDLDESEIQAFFFDILYWNDADYADKPFFIRRAALEKLFNTIPKSNYLFVSETLKGGATKILTSACELGLEGIISKNLTSPYIFGRAKAWLKSKCTQRQEFIICGFVPATDMANAIGSLHIGFNKNGKLVYAGKVGTGFDTKTAKTLFTKLKALRAEKHPFDKKPDAGPLAGTVWVKPELICEVKFAMWTETDKVRHASYQGLRSDKDTDEIGKEVPMQAIKKSAVNENKGNSVAGVTISNPDRSIFPDTTVTKFELAHFYHEMADWIVPQIESRPLSVVRCPGGVDKGCFFQRSKGVGMPEHIYTIDIVHDGKTNDYLYIKNEKGLIELVQMGSIELHPWGSRVDATEKPDRIIFDFDPAEDVPFEAVKLAAQDIRHRLEGLGLDSLLKVTGGKGLHITVPLKRQHEWVEIKEFTRRFAEKMAQDIPEAYTTNMSKKKRSGKIFIDYLRNDFASTAVVEYCVRARPEAPVAVPIDWNELAKIESSSQFTMADVLKRKKAGKLFKGTVKPQALTRAIINKVS